MTKRTIKPTTLLIWEVTLLYNTTVDYIGHTQTPGQKWSPSHLSNSTPPALLPSFRSTRRSRSRRFRALQFVLRAVASLSLPRSWADENRSWEPITNGDTGETGYANLPRDIIILFPCDSSSICRARNSATLYTATIIQSISSARYTRAGGDGENGNYVRGYICSFGFSCLRRASCFFCRPP